MKKLLSVLIVLGIVFLTVPKIIYADDEEYIGFIDIGSDQYIRFGSEEYPADSPYGIMVQPDIESTATYWINLYFEVSPTIIEERKIDKFYVLANGKIIDTIYPQYQDADGNGLPDYAGWYAVKPESWGLAGGTVNFQIVAVSISTVDMNVGGKPHTVETAVAWSNITDTVQMDPVKVNDAEAIGVLYLILNKLNEMMNALSSKLQDVKDELATMFTPSPAAEARLNAAMDNLLKSTPMSDMTEKSNDMKNLFENTQLDEPMERLTFGDKRDWFLVGKEFYLIDLTEVKEQIELIRNLLAAVIWIEFFVFLVFYLSPKLGL